jgi:hypothetical protein
MTLITPRFGLLTAEQKEQLTIPERLASSSRHVTPEHVNGLDEALDGIAQASSVKELERPLDTFIREFWKANLENPAGRAKSWRDMTLRQKFQSFWTPIFNQEDKADAVSPAEADYWSRLVDTLDALPFDLPEKMVRSLTQSAVAIRIDLVSILLNKGEIWAEVDKRYAEIKRRANMKLV